MSWRKLTEDYKCTADQLALHGQSYLINHIRTPLTISREIVDISTQKVRSKSGISS